MKLSDFWETIHGRPWVIRILDGIREAYNDGSIALQPDLVGLNLQPFVIKHFVAGITFHRWGDLHLKGVSLSSTIKDDFLPGEERRSITYRLYYHIGKERLFLRELEPKPGQTVMDCFHELRTWGGRLDAVVRCETETFSPKEIQGLEQATELCEAVAVVLANYKHRSSYQIFLPNE